MKTGARLRSQVDGTELVAIRALPGDVDLTCGGHSMINVEAEPRPGLTVKDGASGGTLLGKRYTLPGTGLELLVTRPGTGSLAVGDQPLVLKEARPLPASD